MQCQSIVYLPIEKPFMDKDLTQKTDRKKDHINLAESSKIDAIHCDARFEYDPVHNIHPQVLSSKFTSTFIGKKMLAPIWISSMTGGTADAKKINQHLAKACHQFGLGMGLGSCRKIIDNPDVLPDFQVRKEIGNQPLFANLGIAQLEQWIAEHKIHLIQEIIDKTEADGLIIHINPMQEWMQAEGDLITIAPLITIQKILEHYNFPIIVKEVGQGMGYKAIESLLKLPLAAFEFGAFGGTNFAMLELLRNQQSINFEPFTQIGHTAEEMLKYVNDIYEKNTNLPCSQLIISGGIRNFLDGYYFINKSKIPAYYGQAAAFLKPAQESYEALELFITQQLQGLSLASAYLTIKTS